jgi:hypothetical protein
MCITHIQAFYLNALLFLCSALEVAPLAAGGIALGDALCTTGGASSVRVSCRVYTARTAKLGDFDGGAVER